MADENDLTIGSLARSAGVGRETVRYYERIGLLATPGRRKGAYRRYTPGDVARLRFIRRAGELGFTLAETSELLALRAREGSPCASVRAKAKAKLTAIEQKLVELTELRDAVAALVRACRGDRAVEHCSILAALGDEEDPARTKKSRKQSTKEDPSWQEQRRHRAVGLVSPAPRRARGASKTV
jgi:MerR family copper efflux transcriptional regulator